MGGRHAKGRGKASVKDLRQKQSGMFRDMSDEIRREWVWIREAGLCRPCRWALIRGGF